MKVSNDFFLEVLEKKLKKAKKRLSKADDFLYYNGITNYDEYAKDRKKYEILFKEIAKKYPELYENLHESWSIVRKVSLSLDKLIDEIKKIDQ